jgi:MSHA biogenesis protein MshJ
MKQWWTAQAARIDALSLRERIFLFVSFIVVDLAVMDAAWLSPAQATHKLLSQRVASQGVELQRLRSELSAKGQPADVMRPLQLERAALEAQLATVNAHIQRVSPAVSESGALTRVLVQLLAQQAGLTLVKTAALVPDEAGSAGLTRQAVVFTVRGSYPDLTRLLQKLETELPDVRWGTLKLNSEKQAPELVVQLFLLGVKP